MTLLQLDVLKRHISVENRLTSSLLGNSRDIKVVNGIDFKHSYTQALLSENPTPDPTTERERNVLRGLISDSTETDDRRCPSASCCPEEIDTCTTADVEVEPYVDTTDHEIDCIRQ